MLGVAKFSAMNIVRTALAAALVVVLAAACGRMILKRPRDPRSLTIPAPSTTGNVIVPRHPAPQGPRSAAPSTQAVCSLAQPARASPVARRARYRSFRSANLFRVGTLSPPSSPFAFRNNTGAAIARRMDRNRSQRQITRCNSSSRGTVPAEVQPGEIEPHSFSSAAAKSRLGMLITYSRLRISPVNKAAMSRAPLKVTEANVSGDAIIGTAVNAGKPVTYPIGADVLLRRRQDAHQGGDIAEQFGPVAPGGQATFSVDLTAGTAQPSQSVLRAFTAADDPMHLRC